MSTEKIVWRFGVHVVGVKKRCRKPDFHSSEKSELGEVDRVDESTREDAKRKAIGWISDNMKTVSKADATLSRWTISEGSETWQPFNPDDNIKIPLTLTALVVAIG